MTTSKLEAVIPEFTAKMFELVELAGTVLTGVDIVVLVHHRTEGSCDVDMVSTVGPAGIKHILQSVSGGEGHDVEEVSHGTIQ